MVAVKGERRLPPVIAYLFVEDGLVSASSGGEGCDEGGEVHVWLCWADKSGGMLLNTARKSSLKTKGLLISEGKKLGFYREFASRLPYCE
jgi:hypothetical protein